jgi:phospholipid/cholesterol/gamma-HCH transport system substrate-binding protein
MKTKNGSPYLIALSVIGCSLVLLAVLTFALTGYHWGGHRRSLEIEFADATGIKLHSSVRYAGAVAGTVVGIRYLQPAERAQPGKRNQAVRVTIGLNDELPPLPSDTKASLSSETMLGEKFIALSAGTPEAKPLANGAVIQGQSLSGIETLSIALERTADAATELLQRVNVDYPTLRMDLTRVLTNGDALLSAGNKLVSEAQGAVADVRGTLKRLDTNVAVVGPQANELLTEAAAAATNLNRTLENTRLITLQVQQFLTNQFLTNLDQNMKYLTSVLARIEITSEYAKILAGKLAEKPSRLVWQVRTNKLPSEEEIRQNRPSKTPPKKSK